MYDRSRARAAGKKGKGKNPRELGNIFIYFTIRLFLLSLVSYFPFIFFGLLSPKSSQKALQYFCHFYHLSRFFLKGGGLLQSQDLA